MPSPRTLVHGEYYHIFNRGNNRDDIFLEDRNYSFFLDRYKRYVLSLVETYAYCLLRNHFHFLVRIKDIEQLPESFRFKKPGIIFGRLFSSYAKSFNSIYGHSGSVFEHPFGRVRIRTGSQLMRVITYIHQNPEKHGYVDDFREWRFSSYLALIGSRQTSLDRETVIGWFGSVGEFIGSHEEEINFEVLKGIFPGDDGN